MDAEAIKRVLIVGAGASGQQVSLQFARFELDVVVQDVNRGNLERCRVWHRDWLDAAAEEGSISRQRVSQILSRITYERDPARAASGIDLLSESVPEQRDIKRQVLSQFHSLCPSRTIFTTNTSYLLPSSLATASGRPERFAALHFHVPVWYANAVDVMPHPRTEPWVVDTLCALAVKIDQTPIRVKRESPGYVFNTMLAPLLMHGLDLAAREVADFQDVDRAWMAVTKMTIGPFGIVDSIGLETVHGIVRQWGQWLNRRQAEGVAQMLKAYIDQGMLGVKSGQGFYSYPHPAYAATGFLAGGTTQPAEIMVAGQVAAEVENGSTIGPQTDSG